METGNENISYYDAIAGDYNDMLDKDPDKAIREIVAAKFYNTVKAGAVLDFGGGTGLDLEWLAGKYPEVFFCEPSSVMRNKAIYNHQNSFKDNVIFLDDAATDFREWNLRAPFPTKVEGILSNFAVWNCIPTLGLLFQNLAGVVNPEGDVIALVLTRNILKMCKNNFGAVLKSYLRRKPVTTHIWYKKNRQTVYIYSLREIIKASSKYFIFCSGETIPRSDFTLIHLKRK